MNDCFRPDQVEQMVISTTSLHDRIHRYVDRLSLEEESGGEHEQDGNLYSRRRFPRIMRHLKRNWRRH
nr:hypothetical protein [Bacillus pumilus]